MDPALVTEHFLCEIVTISLVIFPCHSGKKKTFFLHSIRHVQFTFFIGAKEKCIIFGFVDRHAVAAMGSQ